VAFGAPRLAFSGLVAAIGEGVAVADGVSLGVGVGEDSFFGSADGAALGVGEADFFFFDELADGDGDCFFLVAAFFFLCGVGVGVEKTFLIFSPMVSSAACTGEIARKSKKRKIEIGKRNDPFIPGTLARDTERRRERRAELPLVLDAVRADRA
jgi:hypothetical protein